MTDPSMRVLFVIGGLGVGGSENQLAELVTSVHPERLNASVATLRPSEDGASVERLRRAQVPLIALADGRSKPRSTLSALRRLDRLVAQFRPDVVSAWLEEASLVAAPISKRHGIPLVVARRSIRGPIGPVRPLGQAVRFVERRANLVMVNSPSLASMARTRGVPANRVRLVRNGHVVAPPLVEPPNPPVRIGYVANLRPEKGHMRLLDALERLTTSIPWQCDLAGWGSLEASLREEVRLRGLGDRAVFTGTFASAREFWRSRHIALLLSDHDSCPNAIIEAAMAGRPAIVTDVPGLCDMLPATAASRVPPDDAAATALALSELIDDPALRRSIGRAAHLHVAETFPLDRFVEGHLDALASVASTMRARRPRPAAPAPT